MNGRIGFTTMTFKPALLSEQVTLTELFRWGASQGFSWVELRDFELSFSHEYLQKIKTEAERNKLRVHYAWDTTSVYQAVPREFIFQGIRNAAFFGHGTCSRIVIAPELISVSDGKIGYSCAEFQTLEKHLSEYCRYAADIGVTLAFENSLETLGGFAALLDAVPEMRMTLDTANTFNATNTGEKLEWPQFKKFICRYRAQIPYVHLKSSIDGKTMPDLLVSGDVPMAELLPLLNENIWLCVELPMADDLPSCMKRVSDGLKLIRDI